MNNIAPNFRPLRYIKKNFEWQDYIEEHYTVKYAGNSELRINCPNCGDRKYKLYINVDKKVFNCFKCSFTMKQGSKDVFDFVALTENLTRGQAIMKLLRLYTPVTPDKFEEALRGELDFVPPNVPKFKHKFISSLPSEAVKLDETHTVFWEYLISRGLTPDEITKKLRAHVILQDKCEIRNHEGILKGDIGRRILWPVYGEDGKLVSWQVYIISASIIVIYDCNHGILKSDNIFILQRYQRKCFLGVYWSA